eukprot:TRINITY_DN2885_c0_g1_i4.p1 TRINITY_DN2885_c0_g1~~TRINITY_DN2885_c0_g1_i4.p1  ORF type:complete len:608 (+),score=121.83 TRINITY_DN2885_c0_g1_i4:726-2549(+)
MQHKHNAIHASEDFQLFEKNHSYMLLNSGLPQDLWDVLFFKVSNDIMDSGNIMEFGIEEDEEGEREFFVKLKDEVNLKKHEDVFLIDHAWTTTIHTAKQQLLEHPTLLHRMCEIMNLQNEFENESERKKLIDEIVNEKMWYFNQFYQIGVGNKEEAAVWYIMDELGSRVRHSESPNFAFAPFFYTSKGLSYTIIWPINDLEKGEEITRDYLPGVKPPQRELRLYPWFGLENRTEDELIQKYSQYMYHLGESTACPSKSAVELVESAKITSKQGSSAPPDNSRVLRVFSDMPTVSSSLTSPNYEIVSSKENADVLWFYEQVHPNFFKNIKQGQLVNQFPNETCITVKDLLTETIFDVWGLTDWIPITYNMETHLAELLGDIFLRQSKNEDHTFILKPWNLSRGIGHTITNSTTCLLRNMETGPRIASKYLENPALYNGLKYDLRYMVALKSTKPLELYVYKTFLLRLANKSFSMDDFFDYEKHFTVMTFVPFELKEVQDKQFIEEFNKTNQTPWEKVEESIHRVILDTFAAASTYEKGIVACDESRAIYGVDMILDSNLQPHLLEVNFNPNCLRLLKYEPSFFVQAFDLLFRGVPHEFIEGKPFVRLA